MTTCRNIMAAVFTVLMMQLLLESHLVQCYEYKVGDLDGWNIPSSANPDVYIKWSQSHSFNVGDSLFFLYTPSQDSVIMVTEESYQSCNIQQHILSMNDGNSIFNITCPGDFYFTSGVAGHCESQQKLHISAAGTGTCSYPPPSSSAAPSPLPLPLALTIPSSGAPSTLPMSLLAPLPSRVGGSSPSHSPSGPSPSQGTPSSDALSIHAPLISILPMAAALIALLIFHV